MGWGDFSLSNAELATRFRAALEWYDQEQSYPGGFSADLPLLLGRLRDPRRELARNLF